LPTAPSPSLIPLTSRFLLTRSPLSLIPTSTSKNSRTNTPAKTVLISFLTPLATSGISYSYGFVFVGTNLAAFLVVYFFLYESVSLSLENVDAMYAQPHLKPWTSHKWVPEGYLTRLRRDEAYYSQRRHGHHGGGGGDDVDDRTTAVPSGRPSRAVDEHSGELEKKDSGNGFAGRESREERVHRAV
jgi:SP family sugar:H+ symporter-like MFS transporter